MIYNKKHLESYIFLGLLIFLTGLFYFINLKIKELESEKKFPQLNPKDKEYLEYFYMAFFAIFVGAFVFLGFKYMKPLFHDLAGNEYLGNLLITSTINFFSLTYSGFLEEIFEHMLGEPLKLTTWKNLIGYTVGRGIILLILFIYVYYLSKSDKK